MRRPLCNRRLLAGEGGKNAAPTAEIDMTIFLPMQISWERRRLAGLWKGACNAPLQDVYNAPLQDVYNARLQDVYNARFEFRR